MLAVPISKNISWQKIFERFSSNQHWFVKKYSREYILLNVVEFVKEKFPIVCLKFWKNINRVKVNIHEQYLLKLIIEFPENDINTK